MDPRFWGNLDVRQLGKIFHTYNNITFIDTGYPRLHADKSFLRRIAASVRDVVSRDREARSLCIRCRTVDFDQLFNSDGTFVFAWPVKSIQTRSRNCCFCRLLLDLLDISDEKRYGYCVITSYPSLKIGKGNRPYGLVDKTRSMNRLWVRFQKGKLTEKEPLYEVEGEARMLESTVLDGSEIAIQKMAESGVGSEDGSLLGRLVGESLDGKLLRSWFKTCETAHSEECNCLSLPAESFGMKLIDVTRRCVVDAPPACRYITLSYVWGNTRQLLLTEETKPRLEDRENALLDDDSNVPLTIRDAILACQLLGERYLWVDALCIQQDSDEAKARQLQKMGLIYQCAILTIVAASGDNADSSLPGLRPNSRVIKQHTTEVRGIRICNTLPLFGDTVISSKWNHRGWTCQEKHLSNRLLIFSSTQVFFRCNMGLFSEDACLETQNPAQYIIRSEYIGQEGHDFKFEKHLSPFRRYMELLRDYSNRQLGFDGDALNASSGILNTLSGTYTFFWGLPEEETLETLHWHSSVPDLKRRREDFPSWSWAGWAVPVDTPFFPGGESDSRYPPIIPITSFYRVGKDDRMEPLKIGKVTGQRGDWGKLCEFGPGRDNRELLDEPWAWHIHMGKPIEPPPLTAEELGTCLLFKNRLLRFYTWTFQIPVGREPHESNESAHRLWIGWLETRVWLDPQWRSMQPENLNFMALAQKTVPDWGRTAVHFFLILIEYKNGIAYRVQKADEPVKSNDLFDGDFSPEWKLVTLA